MEKLVSGRDCGSCTACCTVLTIDTPEIQKPAGVTCRHCVNGCVIHDARPPVCRRFYCAWRVLDILGADWRPDISDVFTLLETDGIPPHFPLRSGVSLMLVGDPLKTVRQRWFLEFVGASVMTGIPLFLSLPGPAGHRAVKLLLNSDEMRDAAASRTATRIRQEFEKILTRLRAHPFQPHAMAHSGNNTGASTAES